MTSDEEESSGYDETLSRTSSDVEEPSRPKDAPSTKKVVRVDKAAASNDERMMPAGIETNTIAPTTRVEYEIKSIQAPATLSEEESISAKAREAGRSFKDLVYSIGKKTREVTEQKATELRSSSIDVGVEKDAKEIRKLGGYVDGLVQVFEDTLSEIGKEPYSEQERILAGYHKLLEEQINVIDARLKLAKRLKASSQPGTQA